MMKYKKPEATLVCMKQDVKHADNKRECGEWGCCVKSLKAY